MSSSVVSVTDQNLTWTKPVRRSLSRVSKSSGRRSRSANKKGRSLSPSNKQSAKSASASKNKPIKRTRSLGRLERMGSLPIKPVIKRFISFGCWNRFVEPNKESKKGFGFQKVLPEIQKHVDTQPTDFVLISGDNYYPAKEKDHTTGEKIKTVNAEQLQAGFSILPKNTDVHLILGNHDIETNPSIGKGNIVDSNTQGQTTKCKISELEKSALHPEVGLKDAPKIHIFHAFMWTPNTAIIMFDTSLYDDLDEDTVDCYDKFELIKEFSIEDKRQKRIKEQEDYIMGFLETRRIQPIQNVVLMGHYPIVSIKMKEAKEKDKDKKKEKKSAEESTKDKPKMKEKAECCLFTHLFTNIYNMFDQSKQPRYYYLCSDVHMYQKVIVKIPIVPEPTKTLPGEIETLDTGDESLVEPLKKMEITQYVVGTGGAELDEPPKLNPTEPKTVTIPKTNTEQIVEFNVEQAQKSNGFLECVLYPGDPKLYFEFNPIQ